MNKDAEAINQFLAWLLQEPDPATAPSGETVLVAGLGESDLGQSSFNSSDLGQPTTVDLQSDFDPLDSEVEAMQAELSESSAFWIEDISSLELGEIPAVQDRFHAIIKRRLRVEIERNPPLFPWESQLWDYESEQPNFIAADRASILFWAAQLKALKLPASIPEALLLQIFAECRKVAHSSLRQGVKLVRAVENFFPDELPALNHWAGQVLAEPARGSQTLSIPQSYEQANATQQMVLSLLAARQVLDAMTIEVSADRPQSQRQWLTDAGELVLDVEFQPQAKRLRVQGQLPAAGRLTLNGQVNQATATCAEPDLLSVELGSLAVGHTYSLEVELEAAERSSLVFAVYLSEEEM